MCREPLGSTPVSHDCGHDLVPRRTALTAILIGIAMVVNFKTHYEVSEENRASLPKNFPYNESQMNLSPS